MSVTTDAPNSNEVVVAKPMASGGIKVGPLGSTVPTDATSTLDAALRGAGYVGEDGVTQTIDTETTDIKAWGGDTVRTIQTSHSVTYTFRFLQTNDVVLKEVYGEQNVTSTSTGIAVLINSAELPRRAWVFDMRDGADRIRIVIPEGQITSRSDVTYVHSDAVSYEVTVTAYPDGQGNKAYQYIERNAGAAVVATGATAGTPGSFTPSGSKVPTDLGAVKAANIVASPATAWTTGQYVSTSSGDKVHWDGSAWAAGAAS